MTPKAYIHTGPCYGFGYDSLEENSVVVVHASSRNQARQYVASICDLDYVETSVRRCEVMDGLPITDSLMLKLGLFGWLECFGCRRQIHGEGSDSSDVQEWPNAKDGSPYAYLYPDDDEDDDFPAIKGEEPPEGEVISRPVYAEGVGMFCSDACYAKWHGSEEWHAIRKLRGLEQEPPVARPQLRDIPTDPPSQWTGTDVRLLRRHLRISQTTLAHLLSCYRETVSRWERAADQPIANGPIHRLLDILDSHPEAFGESVRT